MWPDPGHGLYYRIFDCEAIKNGGETQHPAENSKIYKILLDNPVTKMIKYLAMYPYEKKHFSRGYLRGYFTTNPVKCNPSL